MKHAFLRRLSALALAVVLALTLAVPAWAAPAANDPRVQFDNPQLTLAPGDKANLIIRKFLSAQDLTGLVIHSYEYQLSNDNGLVVKMDQNGAIEAISTGTAHITVTLGDYINGNFVPRQDSSGAAITASCTVTVEAYAGFVPVQHVYLSRDQQTLQIGGTCTLTASVTPTNATNKTVTWHSTNTYVADVDEYGVVTAKNLGTAQIYATAGGVSSDPCTITVTYTSNPTLKLDPSSLFLEAGQSKQVKAVVTGDLASITWKSNNTSVVRVTDNGQLTTTVTDIGGKRASATITATAVFNIMNGTRPSTVTRTATCTVTVADSTSTRVDSITLNQKEITLAQDGTYQLTATVSPANAATRAVNWDSDTPSVATVDANGKVTAVGAGEATIIAIPLYGNLRAFCTVKVTPATTSMGNINGTGVYIEGNKPTYTFDRRSRSDTLTVNVARIPSTSADPIQWQVKDATVVTVSGTSTTATIRKGNPGKTTITAVPLGPNGKPRQVGGKDMDPVEMDVIVSGIALEHTSLTVGEHRRETLGFTLFGDAIDGDPTCVWTSSDSNIVTVDRKTGRITGQNKGTARITATKGDYYTAVCSVTVVEDASGLITVTGSHPAGSPVNMSSAGATSDAGSGTLASVLQAVCREKTKIINANGTTTSSSLSYVTNLRVASTDQGILHDDHHSSADTGAGVGINDRYYLTPSNNNQRRLSDLSFVPSTSFSGTAEISYTGYSTDNQSFSGVIRVTVSGTGDVMYASSGGSVVHFQADDFNRINSNLRSVSFTLPQESAGTLYYNYSSPDHPGTKVTATTLYSRTGTPGLDNVAFVPASRYEGTVRIPYKGTTTSGRSVSGTVTITVTNNRGGATETGDIFYSVAEDGWRTFGAADFRNACQWVTGETLSYVRFTLPPSSEGTLFYNYRGFASYDSTVSPTTSYYCSGTPSLGSVAFVPTTTTPSQVDIPYTGYTTRGNTYNATIHLSLNGYAQNGQTGQNTQSGLNYTVFSGNTVNFQLSGFNNACIAATGTSLNYLRFTSLPTSSQGTLRYHYPNSASNNSLYTTTSVYRTSTSNYAALIDNVNFQAAANYVGTVTLPFTGYGTNGASFSGVATIQVTPPTASELVYSGTSANPISLSSSQVRGSAGNLLGGTLSYIVFNNLPAATAGHLYSGYRGVGTGTKVNTGTRYYFSSSPSIDQISFVPRGRYQGRTTVSYTVYNTAGQSLTGQIVLNIGAATRSNYFSDMGGHTWAAASVDYLYQNGVTNGVTSTTFGPNQRIRRCDFVLMLCRAFGFSQSGSGYSFADVPSNAYFAGAVASAKQLGIVNGDGRNFMPYNDLTRQDAMVMIKNALDAAGWNVSTAPTSVLGRFPDGGSVSNYARAAVSTLVEMGAVSGDNGRLYPFNSITRAEAAVILHFVMTM